MWVVQFQPALIPALSAGMGAATRVLGRAFIRLNWMSSSLEAGREKTVVNLAL
jgi:hypothetical protein